MKDEASGQPTGHQPEKKKKDKLTTMFLDYFRTNREITKQYDEEYERQRQTGENKGKKWTGTEKLYMSAIIIGVILIAIKYLVF